MARTSLLPAMKGLGTSPQPRSYTVRRGEEKGDPSMFHRAVPRPAAHNSHRHWGQEAADEVSASWEPWLDGSCSKTLLWAHRVQASIRCGANPEGFVHCSPKNPGCVTSPRPLPQVREVDRGRHPRRSLPEPGADEEQPLGGEGEVQHPLRAAGCQQLPGAWPTAECRLFLLGSFRIRLTEKPYPHLVLLFLVVEAFLFYTGCLGKQIQGGQGGREAWGKAEE